MNFFRAAMGAWGEVLSGTETALNSTGGATERMAIYTESLEGKLKNTAINLGRICFKFTG